MRVLAIFAHPDDEAWAAGGTLARLGEAATVVCASAGEAGADRRGRGGDLGALRRAELEASCAALGVAGPVWLGEPDGQVQGAGVAALLDRWNPDAVISLGDDGAYHHVDHLRLVASIRAALAERPGTCGLFCVFPPGLFHPVWRSLRRSGFPGVPKGLGPDSFGSERADLVVDIAAVAQRKLAAVAAHVSQLPGDDPRGFLRPGLLDELLEVERFDVVGRLPEPLRARLA